MKSSDFKTGREHLEWIIKTFSKEVEPKYMKGVEEYKTKLWQDYSALDLNLNAFEEAIDLVVYLLTQRVVVEELQDKVKQLEERLSKYE